MTFEAQAFDAQTFESLNFESRHIGPSPAEQERMLAATGHASLDELTRRPCRRVSGTRGR